MILELTVKNFLSFKDKVTFSFEATKDKSYEDYYVVEVAPNIRILRLAIVYGANASGKSNLIEVFEFLRIFWFKQPKSKDNPTGVIPFLMDENTPQELSEFTLIFYIDGTKYFYSLELEKTKVISEKLYLYPGTQPALIFKRIFNNDISKITFNPKRVKISQTAKEEISVKCLVNSSVFAAYNQVNVHIPELEIVINWIKSHYKLPCIIPNTDLVNYVEKTILKKQEIKNYVLHFLRQADFNISNIHTEVVERDVPEEMLSLLLNQVKGVPDDEKERLRNERTIKIRETEFEHCVINTDGEEVFYKLPKNFQSQGTLRTFGLSGVIFEIHRDNAFLAIDEIESSLHPRLIEFIIEDFLKHKSQSQLLLTTHYDGLLEEDDLLRKDSVWFTHKKENGSTEIYSLADFKGVNRISSLLKAYKYGKFGAIPNI